MTKKSSSSSSAQNPVQRLVTAVVAVIVVIVALIAGLFSGNNTATETSTPQSNNGQPTSVVSVPTSSGSVTTIPVQQGFGAQKGFWTVYFTAPTGSRDASKYVGGIDTQLVTAINQVQRTLDIAAYEWNLQSVTQAVIDAKNRGVVVRMVTDNDGMAESDSLVGKLIDVGIPVVNDSRQPIMHDKFMIMDSAVVWTGSWNYTINDTYRNNNNAVVLRSQKVVADYQAEFNEMFIGQKFGRTSPSDTPHVSFTQDGTPVQIYYGSEDKVVPAILATLGQAQHTINFMAFSFTLDDVGDLLKSKASSGVQVQGIFETTGSQTQFAELTPLFCAGLPVRQDGNPFVLHHKVFIIDSTTVIAGSFNFSSSARDDNDENMFIITDPDLAAQYTAEFQRRWAEAKTPTALKCN
jgi:phosphatidylserine/phosphatidylglycerophosphate/cardiolipin synthase-like enzyme